MKYTITLKNLELTVAEEKIIARYLRHFEKKLHNFVEDIPELVLFIKWHEKNNFYIAKITLALPRKKLVATMKGHNVHDILHEGFEKLTKEFEFYKAKNFKGSSKYPFHNKFENKRLDI